MTSFNQKIVEQQKSHAYVLGVEAARNNKPLLGPFDRGSSADIEWVEGFLDAVFLKELTECPSI